METNKDQAYYLRRMSGSGKSGVQVPRTLRCISIGSGKGGVGKTMVTVGLAYCLSNMSYRVLVLDADTGLANVDLQMGVNPEFTIQDVIFGNCSLENAVIPVKNGLDLLASSSGTPEMVDMGDARRQMFVDNLIKFAENYDFLIIDVSAGIGKSTTTFLVSSPEVLVVVTNEPTSIMDAYALIKVLSQNNDPPSMMLVPNMVKTPDEGERLAGRLNEITKKFLNLRLPVAGVIPYHECVGDAIRARRPLLAHAEKSAPARGLAELAAFMASGRSSGMSGRKLKNDFFNNLTEIGVKAARETSK